MKKHIHAQPLESAAFAPFGDVIEALGNSNAANQGRAERFDAPLNLANTDPRVPRLHTAIYRIKQSTLPFELKLVKLSGASKRSARPCASTTMSLHGPPARADKSG